MSYQEHLADTFHDAGLTVVELDGWRTRGDDDLDPRGVILHHTVTTTAADRLLMYGRSDLAGPLANWSTQRDGTIHLVAAGTANHAGEFSVVSNPALRWSPRATQNAHTYGDEAINSGTGQPWPPEQIDAMVRAAAAVSRLHGWDESRTIAHHEWTTRKIDPAFINPLMTMDTIRGRIRADLRQKPILITDQEIIMAAGLTITVPEYIESLYQNYLGRASDAKGRSDYLEKIVTGEHTVESVRDEIANSAEAQARK